MRTSASTPVYQSVSRTRTELNIFALARILARGNAQLVACASPGVDERRCERLVNLSPQPINVDFYQFGERVEGVVPDMFRDFFPPDNFAGVAREILKQSVLFGGKFDRLPIAADSLPAGIDLKIADFNYDRAQVCAAPQQCAQPRQQFTELERLRQIVVRAGVQATDAILHRVACRQH